MTPTGGGQEKPAPVAVGLMLCEQVITDAQTLRPSPIGIFAGLVVDSFPSPPQRFAAFAVLTNGHGGATLELVAIRLDTGEEIYSQARQFTFRSPLEVYNVTIRVRELRFPAPGWYDFVLRVSGEPVASRRVRIYRPSESG